jgi:hypothetical protein
VVNEIHKIKLTNKILERKFSIVFLLQDNLVVFLFYQREISILNLFNVIFLGEDAFISQETIQFNKKKSYKITKILSSSA